MEINSSLDVIRAEQNRCRTTNKQAAILLSTFIAECEILGKDDGNREPTESEVTATLQKFVKNIDECLKYRPKDEKLLAERRYLDIFLPKQLSEEEIEDHINKFMDHHNMEYHIKNMGSVMKFFKQTHEGRYDGAVVSRIARELLG